jgi:hypothetical protein
VNQSGRTSVMLLTGAGFASSVLCALLPNSDPKLLGAFFGILLALYFALYEGVRTPLRLVIFICACSAAYPLSMFGAFGFGLIFHSLTASSSQSNEIPLIYMFVGGSIGASIVLISGMVLFGPPRATDKAWGATLLGAIGGGMFGLLGGAIDRMAGPVNNNTETGVFVVWQTGVALVLGALLDMARESRAPSSEQPLSQESIPQWSLARVSAGAFLAAVLAAFGFFVYRSVESHLFAEKQAATIRKLVSEVPSPAVGPLAPLTAEQIFIMHDIADLRPLWPMDKGVTNWQLSLPMPQVSTIGYGLDVANSMPSLQRRVNVQIMQLPNAEWARYQAKYIVTQVRVYCESCASRVASVTKFGNRVFQISGQPSEASFLWSSGSLLISITKENAMSVGGAVPPAIAAAEEDVLRLYLEKYPSK